MTIHFTKALSHLFYTDSCSICLEALYKDNPTTSVVGHSPTSEAHHVFHESCASEHLTQDQTCPLCREPVANYLELTSQEAIDIKRGEHLVDLVEEGDLHSVVTLLASHEILAYHRGIATIEASIRNDEEILSVILNRSISEDHRGLAFYEAMQNENFLILENLLRDGDISLEYIQQSFLWASGAGNCEFLEFMLQRIPISDHIRGTCVVYACDMGNFDALKLLLSDSELSSAHLGKAFVHSAQHGNWEVMELLAGRHEVLTEFLHSAFLEAVKNHHLECIQRLFELHTNRLRPCLAESLRLSAQEGLHDMTHFLSICFLC